MNAYTTYHALNDRNMVLFNKWKYDPKTGVENGINLEDEEGSIGVKYLPVRMLPTYTGINLLKEYNIAYLQRINEQPLWYFKVDPDLGTLTTSKVKVSFVTHEPPNSDSLKSAHRQAEHLSGMMKTFIPDQKNIPHKMIAMATFSRIDKPTLTKLKKLTKNIYLFRIFEFIDRPFDISSNMDSRLKASFATVNHIMHKQEFLDVLKEVIDLLPTDNKSKDDKALCFKVFKGVINRADYSNFPCGNTKLVFANIYINSIAGEDSTQMFEKSLVYRVMRTSYENYKLELFVSNTDPYGLRDAVDKNNIEKNNHILADIVDRTTVTMDEILFDFEIYSFLFAPLGYGSDFVNKTFIERDAEFITTWKTFIGMLKQKIIRDKKMVYRLFADANSVDSDQVSVEFYEAKKIIVSYSLERGAIIYTTRMANYKRDMLKLTRAAIYGIQPGMLARVLQTNLWQTPWLRAGDKEGVVEFEFACALDIVARFVRIVFEKQLSDYEASYWPVVPTTVLLSINNNKLDTAWSVWARCSFSFNQIVHDHLFVLADITAHSLKAVTSRETKDRIIKHYTDKLIAIMQRKPLALRNLVNGTESIYDYNIYKHVHGNDFVHNIMVNWIGYPEDMYARYVDVIANHRTFATNLDDSDIRDVSRFSTATEPIVCVTGDNFKDRIMVLAEPDFYVFYLFYRILFKAADDSLLREVAVKSIKLTYFNLFTQLQDLLHNYTGSLTLAHQSTLIDSVINDAAVNNNNFSLSMAQASYNPIMMLPRLTRRDKTIIMANAVGIYINKACSALFTSGIDETLDLETLMGFLSGSIVNSGNAFLHPMYMHTEQSRKTYSDMVGYVNAHRMHNAVSLVEKKLRHEIKEYKLTQPDEVVTLTYKVHPERNMNIVTLDACVEFAEDIELTGEMFFANWAWTPTRDTTGSTYLVSENGDNMYKDITRVSVHRLHIEVADGFGGVYTFIFGSSKFGYLKKSIKLSLKLKCVRTGRWFEEAVDNQRWGGVTWFKESPYVYRGWYSAYHKEPYACMLPPWVCMIDLLNSFDLNSWLFYCGDVLTDLAYLLEMIHEQRSMWIKNRVFTSVQDGIELVYFLFYFLAQNQKLKINAATGCASDLFKFGNSIMFVDFFMSSVNNMEVPTSWSRRQISDVINVSQGRYDNTNPASLTNWNLLKRIYKNADAIPASKEAKTAIKKAYSNPRAVVIVGKAVPVLHQPDVEDLETATGAWEDRVLVTDGDTLTSRGSPTKTSSTISSSGLTEAFKLLSISSVISGKIATPSSNSSSKDGMTDVIFTTSDPVDIVDVQSETSSVVDEQEVRSFNNNNNSNSKFNRKQTVSLEDAMSVLDNETSSILGLIDDSALTQEETEGLQRRLNEKYQTAKDLYDASTDADKEEKYDGSVKAASKLIARLSQ